MKQRRLRMYSKSTRRSFRRNLRVVRYQVNLVLSGRMTF